MFLEVRSLPVGHWKQLNSDNTCNTISNERLHIISMFTFNYLSRYYS